MGCSVLVLDGTGGTDRGVVHQALDRGWSVHALVRDALRQPTVADRLTVVTGTPMAGADVRNPMAGVSAVLSALGRLAHLRVAVGCPHQPRRTS